MLQQLFTFLRLLLWPVLIILLLVQCKKAEDTPSVKPTPTPTQEPIVPGVNVGLGAILLDKAEYEKTPLFPDPLAGGRLAATGKDPNLPAAYFIDTPPPGNQGIQGSCVTWSMIYATRSYFNKAAKGFTYKSADGNVNPETVFSPAYVYNQLNGGNSNGGTTAPAVFKLLQAQGVCTLKDMPYNEKDFTTQPNADQKQKASAYKIDKWGRINITVNTFRKYLYFDYPVIIASVLDRNIFDLKQKDANGEYIWKTYDNSTAGTGAHAMVIIGYDDTRKAFKIQNSWSERWANGGYIWLSYDILDKAVYEAYVMIPNEINPNLKGPTLKTESTVPTTGSQQTLSGTITNLGELPIIRYGICTSTVSTEPTDQIEVRNIPVTALPYSFSVTLPVVGGKLYYRAFAETPKGIEYGATNTIEAKAISTAAPGTLVINDESNIWTFDATTGNLKWKYYKFKLFTTGLGTVTPTTYYIGDTNGNLLAFNLSDGTIKWQYPTGTLSSDFPVVINNVVYFTSGETVYALDALTGAKKWAYTTDKAGILYNITVSNGLVFFGINTNGGFGDKKILALDANTGQKKMEYAGYNDVVSLKVSNGLLYAIDNTSSVGNFKAYDIATGQIKWNKQLLSIRQISVSNNILYVYGFDKNPYLSAYDATNGTLKWQRNPANNPFIYTFSLYNNVLVAATDNTFLALDALTGDQKWTAARIQIKTSNRVDRSLVTPSVVYTTDYTNGLTAYDVQTGKQIWSNSSFKDAGWSCLVSIDGTIYHQPDSGMQP